MLRAEDRTFLRELRGHYGPHYDRGEMRAWGAYAGAGHWENRERWRLSAKGILDVYRQYVAEEPGLVLELGCGTGAMTEELNRLGVRAYGLDWGGNCRYPRTTLGNALEMPFAARFDLVVALDVIEHIPMDLEWVLFSELRRIAAGHLIATVPTTEPHFSHGRDVGFRNHYLSASPTWWRTHFSNRGFELVAEGKELARFGPPFAWGDDNYPFLLRRTNETQAH